MHTAQIGPLGCAPTPGEKNQNLLRRKRLFSLRAAGAVSASMLCVMPPAQGGLAAPAVAMPGLGLLVATTAVAVLAFSAVLDRARAAYAWFDALVAPEDDRTVSVDDVLRTVCGVLALWLVPFSSICWHLLKWLAPTGRLMLYELVQIVLFGLWYRFHFSDSRSFLLQWGAGLLACARRAAGLQLSCCAPGSSPAQMTAVQAGWA